MLESLRRWLSEACARGVLPVSEPERAAGSLLALLIGEAKVRQLLGAAGPLDAGESRRSAAASAAFQRLWLGRH